MAEDDKTNIVNIDFYKQSELSRYIIILVREFVDIYTIGILGFTNALLGALEVWPALKIWN